MRAEPGACAAILVCSITHDTLRIFSQFLSRIHLDATETTHTKIETPTSTVRLNNTVSGRNVKCFLDTETIVDCICLGMENVASGSQGLFPEAQSVRVSYNP